LQRYRGLKRPKQPKTVLGLHPPNHAAQHSNTSLANWPQLPALYYPEFEVRLVSQALVGYSGQRDGFEHQFLVVRLFEAVSICASALRAKARECLGGQF
jgi:hypothetical protein